MDKVIFTISRERQCYTSIAYILTSREVDGIDESAVFEITIAIGEPSYRIAVVCVCIIKFDGTFATYNPVATSRGNGGMCGREAEVVKFGLRIVAIHQVISPIHLDVRPVVEHLAIFPFSVGEEGTFVLVRSIELQLLVVASLVIE